MSIRRLETENKTIEGSNRRWRLLIVDDEPSICQTLKHLLAKTYEVETAENGTQAIALLRRLPFDLLLTDMKMPDVDGVQVMKVAKELQPDIEVIMITGFSDISLAVKVVRQGAFTYITKPFKIDDIHLNVRHALEKRRAELERRLLLQRQRELKEELLREEERRRVQEETVVGNITSLIKALEGKDTYTRGHSERVTIYAGGITRYLNVDSDFAIIVERSARLHDIGKIGIRDCVLQKPGRLTPEEYAEIKLHPSLGAEIIRPVPFLRNTIEGIGHHHESFDGHGYPDGLEGKDIPLVARIMAVADTYDAMTSTRAYRVKLAREIAVNELLRCSGLPFDVHHLHEHRRGEFVNQICQRRIHLETNFLLSRSLHDAAPRIQKLLKPEQDYRQEFVELLPSAHARELYRELRERLDDVEMLARQAMAERDGNILSRLATNLKTITASEPLAEHLNGFIHGLRKEAKYCLVNLMKPRMQFDPAIVMTFHEYVTAEPALEADIPSAFLPT